MKKTKSCMTQLTPEQLRAQRLMDKRNRDRDEKDRLRKKKKLEMRGKKVICGRVYQEQALCKTKHDALKAEKKVREENGNLPTRVEFSAKGWMVWGQMAA